MIRLGSIVGSELLFGRWPRWLDLTNEQMLTHKHVLGTTGSGKSKFLESIFLQSLKEGKATTFIDPDGSSAEYILCYLATRGFFNNADAFNKLIYVEFADADYFFPMNILQIPWASDSEKAEIIIEAFTRAYPEVAEGAANFYKIMDAAIKVLIANDLPIIALEEVLTVKSYRDLLLQNVTDDHVVSFFKNNFDSLIDYHRQGQTASTLNRGYDLAARHILYMCMGQKANHFNVADITNGGKFVIVNLGPVKDYKTMRLLGSFITHSYEMGIQSRIANSALPPHQLIMDEFGLFASNTSDTFSHMLTRTRKYGLFLTLCHQDWNQTNPLLQGALGGCGVKISFRTTQGDGVIQAKALADFDQSQTKGAYPSGGPILASVQDQYEQWATALKTLPSRQALVRIGTNPTVKIQTPPLPDITIDRDMLNAIKAVYFGKYYTHKDQIKIDWGQHREAPNTKFRQRIKP